MNKLLLLSGQDVPFVEAQVNIHQPKLSEVALIGEKDYLIGTQFLLFDKEKYLTEQDKIDLSEQSNFQVFMSIMKSKLQSPYKTNALMVLQILFPEYNIKMGENGIELERGEITSYITEQNFEQYQDLVKVICSLGKNKDKAEYKPIDAFAKKIAEKINKGKQKRNKQNGTEGDEDISIIYKMAVTLSVGLGIGMSEVMDYSIYRANVLYNTFQAKKQFDNLFRIKLAGGGEKDELINWENEI